MPCQGIDPQFHPWFVGCNKLGPVHDALAGHWLARNALPGEKNVLPLLSLQMGTVDLSFSNTGFLLLLCGSERARGRIFRGALWRNKSYNLMSSSFMEP